MTEYRVHILPSADINWDSIAPAMIGDYHWGGDYRPEAGAKVVYVKSGRADEGIYAMLWCREAKPRAIYTQHNEPVYNDSCLEFFFTMNAPGQPEAGYINIEANSNPTTLIAYGFDRHTRTPIVDMGIDPFSVTAIKTADRWELIEFIPLSVLKKVFHLDAVTDKTDFRGNFYKCGADSRDAHGHLCSVEHYGAWAPINTPAPDFHRPECFGKLKLE